MRCPYCRHADSRVVDSREADDGQLIRRRRSCPECGKRFTTVEEAVLAVVKRSGVTEPFSRTKIMSGVRKACQGRPVDEDSIALLAQKVEETVRAKGAAEVPSHDVGLAILAPAARAGPGGLSAVRERLQVVRLARRVRAGDHRAARGDGRPGGRGRRHAVPAAGRPRSPTATAPSCEHRAVEPCRAAVSRRRSERDRGWREAAWQSRGSTNGR